MRDVPTFLFLLVLLPLELCLAGLNLLLMPIACALTAKCTVELDGISISLAVGMCVMCLVMMLIVCRSVSARFASSGKPSLLAYLPLAAGAWSFVAGCLQLSYPVETIALLNSTSLLLFLVAWLVVVVMNFVPDKTAKLSQDDQ